MLNDILPSASLSRYRVAETMRAISILLFACLVLAALADDNAAQLEKAVGTILYMISNVVGM